MLLYALGAVMDMNMNGQPRQAGTTADALDASAAHDMSNKRFRFGFCVSILWLGVIAVLLVVQRADALSSMKPNEWGDFFAGVFAPLAFLWLVLGYLQQGQELKLSTRALLLQAEELKNSVEQQRALVEVSRLQVEGEREALAYERELRERAAMPHILVAYAGGGFHGNGSGTYDLMFTNAGNTATLVFAELTIDGHGSFHLLNLPFFASGAEERARFTVHTPLTGTGSLRLTYKDTLGRDSGVVFSMSRKSEQPHSELLFTKLAP